MPTDTDDAEEAKAVVRRLWNEVFNAGRLEVAEELIAAKCMDHGRGEPIDAPVGAVKRWFAPLRDAMPDMPVAFPDVHSTLDALFAEGDRVAVRGSERGTHREAFRGALPDGKLHTVTVVNVLRVADGRIVERWGAADVLAFLRGVGLGPA
jgi:predicted SnoaL-like aldol condensation-catalyzing enzyme